MCHVTVSFIVIVVLFVVALTPTPNQQQNTPTKSVNLHKSFPFKITKEKVTKTSGSFSVTMLCHWHCQYTDRYYTRNLLKWVTFLISAQFYICNGYTHCIGYSLNMAIPFMFTLFYQFVNLLLGCHRKQFPTATHIRFPYHVHHHFRMKLIVRSLSASRVRLSVWA